MPPLREVLQEHGQLPRSEAIDAVVRPMGITDEQRAFTRESNDKSLVRAHWLDRGIRPGLREPALLQERADGGLDRQACIVAGAEFAIRKPRTMPAINIHFDELSERQRAASA